MSDEITRLRAENERLKRDKLYDEKRKDRALLVEKHTIRDDALEEAAQALDAWNDIYGDNAAAAIRALKGATR